MHRHHLSMIALAAGGLWLAALPAAAGAQSLDYGSGEASAAPADGAGADSAARSTARGPDQDMWRARSAGRSRSTHY